MPATPREVAEWMLADLDSHDGLYQDSAVGDIMHRFGEEFAWYNENGNPAIDKRVLAEFAELTGDSVVWVRSHRLWRHREPGDEASRQQA
jgi:hypothetical protein